MLCSGGERGDPGGREASEGPDLGWPGNVGAKGWEGWTGRQIPAAQVAVVTEVGPQGRRRS